MDVRKRGRGRPRQHDWVERFGRGRFVLRPGVDYRCRTSSILKMMSYAASILGVRVSVAREEDGTVRVKVLKGTP